MIKMSGTEEDECCKCNHLIAKYVANDFFDHFWECLDCGEHIEKSNNAVENQVTGVPDSEKPLKLFAENVENNLTGQQKGGMMAKSKVSDYEIIYKGEQPNYIRDEGGMLFEFPHITRWPGQDQRYQEEKDEQIALAEYLLDCLGKRVSEMVEPMQDSDG